jgi:hypothetical protein
VREQVERDVDAAGARGHLVGVGVDGALVERVHHRGLGRAPRRADVVGDRLERRRGPAGQVDRGALAPERPRHGPADGKTPP